MTTSGLPESPSDSASKLNPGYIPGPISVREEKDAYRIYEGEKLIKGLSFRLGSNGFENSKQCYDLVSKFLNDTVFLQASASSSDSIVSKCAEIWKTHLKSQKSSSG